METLEKELLLRELGDFGYQLVNTVEKSGKNTLGKLLVSSEGRLLEGVPVVLFNVLTSDPKFNLEELEFELPHSFQKRFRLLAAATLSFCLLSPDGDLVYEQLSKYLEKREPGLRSSFSEKMHKSGKLNVGEGVVLDAERLEKTFRNYVVHQAKSKQETVSRQLEQKKNLQFRAALSELFTEKQVELMEKMLKGSEMSKTDREYYSRTVKPRLRALRNEHLQALANVLLES